MNYYNKIHIEEPCRENWNKMTPKDEGRFCNSCNKVVVDFSNKSLSDIQSYLTSLSKPVCGIYSKRNTTSANKLDHFLNRFESTLSKYRMNKLAMFFISIVFFISGCHRRTMGYYAGIGNYRSADGSAVTVDSTKTEHKTPEPK